MLSMIVIQIKGYCATYERLVLQCNSRLPGAGAAATRLSAVSGSIPGALLHVTKGCNEGVRMVQMYHNGFKRGLQGCLLYSRPTA
jgi:hypothetical protein